VFQAGTSAGGGTTVQSSTLNIRAVNIQNNQLYFSTQSGNGIYQVGSGTPTTAATATLLFALTSGTGSPSP
jgi:hypothetical protein